MLIIMMFDGEGDDAIEFPYVFAFEVVAIEAFAISWLRKAKTVQFLA